MGRQHNQMVTYNDLEWMQNNGLLWKRIPNSGSNLCAIAMAIRSYPNIKESLISNYPFNRLVPYQKIKQMPTLKDTKIYNDLDFSGDTDTIDVFNSATDSWTITFKIYRWFRPIGTTPIEAEDTNGDWFEISPMSGSGAPTLTMYFGYNDTPDPRRVELTITSDGGNTSQTVNLYQDANPGVATDAMSVALGTGAVNACLNFADVESRLDYFVKDGLSWTGADLLFTNEEGTTLADSGWYSNGAFARYWNKASQEFSIISAPPGPTTSTPCSNPDPDPDPDPQPNNNMIVLARYQTTNTAQNACDMWDNNVTQIYYIPHDRNWSGSQGTPVLYKDEEGTTLAGTGWYSDGNAARLWISQSSSFISSASCG